jgi:hypothetical protein
MDLSSNGDENRKRARRKEGGRRGGVEWRTHHTTGRNDKRTGLIEFANNATFEILET